jgi:transcriptional regulator with XRE-family HTH domain
MVPTRAAHAASRRRRPPNGVSTREPISTELRAARRRAGLSQEFLGKLIGATQQAVSRWEKGLGKPERVYWSALQEVLGIDMSSWEPSERPSDRRR